MTEHYTDKGHLLIRNSDIKDSYFEFGENPIYLDEDFSEQNKSRMHQLGDVITVHTGDIGTSAVIGENEVNSIGFATIVTRPNQEVLDSNYFATYLNTDTHKQWAISMATGDGRSNYNLKDYTKLIVPIPHIEEQRKIADCIGILNNLVTLHQRKHSCNTLLINVWEQRKLGEVCERVQGNDGRMSLPTLTISAANGWMSQEARFSGNIAGKEQKNYTLLHKGELSYNHGNSKLAKYGTVFSLETYEEALVPRVYHSFRMTEGDASFIEYYFATKIPNRELAKLISSGARMDGLLNIGFDEFMGININLPSIKEQERISDYLRSLDNLITLHQRKCDETKELKKFMLQKMFPKNGEKKPEIRFEGFTDDWEQRKLSEVAEIVGGGTPSTNIPEYWDGDIDWYAPAEINDQIYVDGSERKITKLGLEKSSAKILPADKTVLFTSRAGIGKTAILRRSGATNQGFQSMVLNDETNPYFVFSMSKFIKEEAERVASGSTFAEVSGKMLGNLAFMFPTKKEQDKIGEYFSNLDNLITLHQRKCDEIKEIKKFMLQNMFPQKG